ncbi:MAG TPA: YihY/virulence factor BrkB family protein [Pilimelia sp.]|nr:YihY/virulence factor BrkB family protein [Pilimelia sp.]
MTTHDQRDRTSGGPPGPDAGPQSPTKLGKRSWWAAIKNTAKEFSSDNLTDWAAALTYYGVLSIFPGLLVLVSLLGLLGQGAIRDITANIEEMVPNESARETISKTITDLQGSQGAGLFAILGLVGAFWSASGYIGAFMRAANAIYDVPEGRPIWKTIPIRIATTAVIGLLLIVSILIVVFTGPVAEQAGEAIGIGSAAVTAWQILKWPVLILLVSLMFAILYWASPNARQGGFRWVSVGGLVAVLLWVVASLGFSFYVANFGSYNKTYGAVAGVIVFLVWLWISNIAILFGAELDAELERQRVAATGHPSAADEPFLQLRDDSKVKDNEDRDLA